MDPISASNGTGVATGLMDALAKSRTHTQHLLDAVQGAQHKKSMWHSLCKELGDNCKTIVPLLDQLQTELQQSTHMSDTMEAMEAAMDALGLALQDGTALVVQCQTATRSTLFVRGGFVKEKFHKVAECIVKCLRNISLTSITLTAHIQDAIGLVVEQLEMARFELSEEDRAIFKDIQQVLDSEGVQSEDTHLATLSVLRQIENRLNMNLGDITQEIRATRGNGAVDLDSMEQSFMSQILRLFVERSNGVGAGSSSSVGNVGVGPSSSRSAQRIRSEPPAYLLCPITLELMRDPVMDCFGHTFERSAIIDALLHKPGVSPNTNQPYPDGDPKLQINYIVRDAVEAYMEEEGTSAVDETASSTTVECASQPLPSSQSLQNASVYTTMQPAYDHNDGRNAPQETSSTGLIATSTRLQQHTSRESFLESSPPINALISAPNASGLCSTTRDGRNVLADTNQLSPMDVDVQVLVGNVQLFPGERVRLVGLVETPHLNGRVGTCVELSEGHWTVALDGDDDEIVLVQERNMEIVIPPPPASARAARPLRPSAVQPASMHIQAQDGTVALGASGSQAHNTSVMNTSPANATAYSLPGDRTATLPSELAHEAQVEVPFRQRSCSSGRMFLACGAVVAVLTAVAVFVLAMVLGLYGDSGTPAASRSVPTTSPSAITYSPPSTFIHPCTGAVLNSARTTRVHFSSVCTGTIPTYLGQLTALTYLSFNGASSLTGTIPTQLGQLTALTWLSFYRSSLLTGTIPMQLGQLTALTSLSFTSAASLTGTIPTYLGQLTALRYLSFKDALSLSGTVPAVVQRLPELYTCDDPRGSSCKSYSSRG